MAEPHIRVMTADDVPRAAALQQACFGGSEGGHVSFSEGDLHVELARSWGRLWVLDGVPSDPLPARLDRPLDGMIVSWHVLDEVHLLSVAVAPALQRRGYGRRLVDHLIGYARGHDAARILLEVRVDNVAAIALYEQLGFEVTRTRRAYYTIDAERSVDGLEMLLNV
jgi:ribosomal-protein-alanine N-acetyltransferase